MKQVPSAVEDPSAVRRISRWDAAILLLLTSVAVVRVFATYKVFNQTYDEPFHIAAGMEWLDKGANPFSYTIYHEIRINVFPNLDQSLRRP